MKNRESGQRGAVACATALAVAFVLAAADATAFSQPIGTKVTYVKPGDLYKFVATPTWWPWFPITEFPMPATGAGDPFALGGSVKVTLNGEQLTCTLAPQAFDHGEGWLRIIHPNRPRRWKYINRWAPDGGIAGACKYVLIKKKVIRVFALGTGSLVVLGEGLNSDVSMELVAGSDRYCALATPPYFVTERPSIILKAYDAPPPYYGCPGSPSGAFLDVTIGVFD